MRKPVRWLIGLVAVVVVGLLAVRLLRVPELAHIGAGYTAQQTCACLFISGRALDSCRMDLDRLARWFIQVKVGTDEVSTRAFGFSRATSRYQKGFGCSLSD